MRVSVELVFDIDLKDRYYKEREEEVFWSSDDSFPGLIIHANDKYDMRARLSDGVGLYLLSLLRNVETSEKDNQTLINILKSAEINPLVRSFGLGKG